MRLLTQTVLRLFAIVGLLLAAGVVWFWSSVHKPLPGISTATVITVPAGAAAATVAQRLHDQAVIATPALFTAWARLSGRAAKIQAGEYELQPGLSMADILDLLVAGRVKLYAFTIVEGWNWREVRDALAASDVIRSTRQFVNAADMAAVLPEGEHPEGRLFPDTYAVARGTTDVALLQRAAALMSQKLAAAWAGRAPGLPLETPLQLLTLASIVERETSLDAERAQVAGVFVRRLRKGMRLQTDPTVIYGLGERFDGNLTRRHLLSDTAYNTYTRSGLPPTPIAMPGDASLAAAAHPAAGNSLYFVASERLDGSHEFSATLEEHNAAVAAYLAALRRARKQSK